MADQKDFQREQVEKAFSTVGKFIFLAIFKLIWRLFEGSPAPKAEAIAAPDAAGLISARQAAELLNVKKTAFWALVREHGFGKVKIGKASKFSKKKILAYIAAQPKE